MPVPRSGPFAWSPFGAGYLVASADETGRPVVDLVLPSPPDGSLRWVAAFGPDEAELLASLAAPASAAAAPESPSGLRDGVAALEAALDDLSAGRAPADAAVAAVDDLLRRLARLRGELAVAEEPSAPSRPAAAAPSLARSADRRLTTMGGLALALGIVAVFWIVLGVLLWLLLR